MSLEQSASRKSVILQTAAHSVSRLASVALWLMSRDMRLRGLSPNYSIRHWFLDRSTGAGVFTRIIQVYRITDKCDYVNKAFSRHLETTLVKLLHSENICRIQQ